jgi:epoxyqueuosine reductase
MLADLLALDDAGFRQLFAGSPIKRIGRDRMMRNCLIAAGNSRAGALAEAVRGHLDDPNPVVRGAAVWALGRLDADAFAEEREARFAVETDEDVRDEWAAMSVVPAKAGTHLYL